MIKIPATLCKEQAKALLYGKYLKNEGEQTNQ